MIKNWLLQKHSLFKYCTKRAYRIKNLHSWKLSGFTQPEQKQLSGIMKGTASKNDLFFESYLQSQSPSSGPEAISVSHHQQSPGQEGDNPFYNFQQGPLRLFCEMCHFQSESSSSVYEVSCCMRNLSLSWKLIFG